MRPDAEFIARDSASHPPALTPIYKTSVFRSPQRPLLSLQNSLSEVTGPVFGAGDLGPFDHDLIRNYARDGGAPIGERIIVRGRVLDGTGRPVPGVLIELWQADAAGRYPHPADRQPGAAPQSGFRGWGRTGTDFTTGLWSFETIKPGRVLGRSGHRAMAPHVSLCIVARGINLGLSTRLYFGDEPDENREDPVLRMIEQPERRATLVSRPERRGGMVVHAFDIRLQGEGETVFLDI